METKTIILDGIEYELKPIQPQPQPEPTLPTLQDVFNKIRPEWHITELNNVEDGIYCENDTDFHNNLSTERQCKRIQALIALQNIADYYNGEVDYRGAGYVINKGFEGTYRTLNYANSDSLTPKFKSCEHAESAIEILRNAQLLDNL